MKNLFKTRINIQSLHIVLLLTRILIGSFMIVHGLQKTHLLFAPGGIQFADPIGVGMTLSLLLTLFAEIICSGLILIGFGTRLAVIPLIITMIVAVFVVHADHGFAKQEMGLQYLMTYILLLVTGSGKYSIDQLISKR
jgi:putative oxidoreductase